MAISLKVNGAARSVDAVANRIFLEPMLPAPCT